MGIDELTRQITRLQQQIDGLIKPEVPLTLIAESVLTGSVVSVTFSSIPSNFRHLILFVQARTDAVAELDNIGVTFNGDAAGNYDRQEVYGNAATAAATGTRATTIIAPLAEGANARANNFSPAIIFLPGYGITTQEKWLLCFTAAYGDVSADNDMYVLFRTARWRNTAAITTIALGPATGPNFVSGSRFQLYGFG